MRNEIILPRRILILSIAIPSVFVVSMLIFFALNTTAYERTPLLDLLQFNLKNVAYGFVPGIFGYALVGGSIVLLWLYIWKTVPKMKAATLVFVLSGILLIMLGVKPGDQDDAALRFGASILYVLLTVIGLIILLIKATETLNKWILSIVLIFTAYELVDRFILFNHDFDINALIVMCFVWYLYLFKYLKSELAINNSRQITL